jgi:superfamily I DNA/RNA helicase
MTEITKSTDKYAKARKEREKYVDAVLSSISNNKIVVGGPGTGKTYLFKKLLEGKKNSLTLTFINHLVEDLSLELCGLSEVRTLHSFAHSVLSRHSKGIKIFPDLWKVIKEDAIILLNEEVDFNELFHNRLDKNEYIEFYKKRRKYYKHYGYSDIIYGAVLYLEKLKDKIPNYDQIVVDEFQDFNTLEVSLIDLLSEKSPVLLAGDDDQALYDFKSASTKHIRERHSENNPAYASFSLPHCSRCTRVIVETANDIIKNAAENGFLINRIAKNYHYFEDKVKDKESAQYNKVVYCQRFAAEIPWFIEQQIGNIANDMKDTFSVLIISPLRKKAAPIVKALKKKGFENVEFVEKKAPK